MTMNPYLMEKMASEHDCELHMVSTRSRPDRQASQARMSRRAAAHAGHPHLVRRRAGWALVSLGLRLAYAAGED
jgi:hypothetical protein